MSIAFLFFTPDARNLRGFSIVFPAGAAFGLLMFAPAAAAEKFRAAIRGWLERYWAQLQPRVSFVMGLALGYFIASARHKTFDALTFISIGLVFLGAVVGIVVGIVIKGDQRGAT
jgi:hypothetical protein